MDETQMAEAIEAIIHDKFAQSQSKSWTEEMKKAVQQFGAPMPGRQQYGIDQATRAVTDVEKKFRAFVDSCLTPIEWMYATVVMLPEKLSKRFVTVPRAGVSYGTLFGTANVICIRFVATPLVASMQPEAVFQIPDQLMRELTAEDVEKALNQ